VVGEDTTGPGVAVRLPDPGWWSIARMRIRERSTELAIDAEDCRLVYVVVSIGGFTGVGEKTNKPNNKEKNMKETSEKSVAMYGVVPASKIIGEPVVNHQGENVGKIHELLIDAKKNRVAYAVLSFGGFIGMGNKLFAMPWEAFEFSTTKNKLILNVDKEKLKTAPGFEKGDKWPDFSDKIWGESIYNYYNYVPPWKS
jgi:sporulation protein YlmC with PRC-barrel domain